MGCKTAETGRSIAMTFSGCWAHCVECGAGAWVARVSREAVPIREVSGRLYVFKNSLAPLHCVVLNYEVCLSVGGCAPQDNISEKL